jgi:hypothetical protein
MKFSLLILLFLASCANHDNVSKKDPADTTGTGKIADSLPPALTDSILPTSTLQQQVSSILNAHMNEWVLASDSNTSWQKDEFDYFVVPKRKTDPDYPYLAKGDYDADGKVDVAALVKKRSGPQFELLIISDYQSAAPHFSTYKEDIDLCAITTYPRETLTGINGEKVKMKGDGIGVEYFEKSSFVVYWNGKGYKRVWTGD